MSDLLGKNHLKAYTGEAENSLLAICKRGSNMRQSKEITLAANNTSETINVFQVTGSICIDAIFGEVTDATTLTNCTAMQLTAYDGTNTVNITGNGAAISGASAGTFIIKTGITTSDLSVNLNDQVRLIEVADKKPHQPFIVTQKSGTNTYIRFSYATTDAPINAKIKWYVCYHTINGGSITGV